MCTERATLEGQHCTVIKVYETKRMKFIPKQPYHMMNKHGPKYTFHIV